MTKQLVSTDGAPRNPTYSQAVRAAGLIFVSGQGPFDPVTGALVGTTIQEQTRQSLGNEPGESASSLEGVFQNLPTNRITKHEVMEIGVFFVALSALAAALALLLGRAWRPLP